MNTAQSDTNTDNSPATELGEAIRTARKSKGWTLMQLAEKIGRPREWLNRVELGYSEYGEHKPPSQADLRVLSELLGDALPIQPLQLLELGLKAQENFDDLKRGTKRRTRYSSGKLTQAEVIIGETAISDAVIDLIHEQHSDALLRNIGIKNPGNYVILTEDWKRYREALGEFLANNPNGSFKRLEYASDKKQLEHAKRADERLAGGRPLSEVHNAKVKFVKHNPLQMHVLIGQREAILALPQNSWQAGSSIALLVRDKLFVEALRVWYDEVLWEASDTNTNVDFKKFDESFDEIAKMYGFDKD